MTRWLDTGDIEYFHRAQIAEHGGLAGIKNPGALDSTLHRPLQLQNYNPKATIYELAASIGHGFAKNHEFNDGKKRVALMSMFVFLGYNDLRLNIAEEEAVAITLAAVASEMTEQALAGWLETNCETWLD